MTRTTEDQKKQLEALDAIRDADTDLSDIPDQGNKTNWTSGWKGLPYQTYIKQLLHDALDKERAAQ